VIFQGLPSGNSHWPSFEGGKTPAERLSQPIILMLPLR